MHAGTQEHRLFFAARLDEAAGAVFRFTERLKRQEGLRGRPIAADRLHVTLWGLGRTARAPAAADLDRAAEAAGRVVLAPFKAAFNRVQSWRGSNGPLVLVGDEGVIGLERLHGALAEAHGLEPAPGFVAHVSLIWSPDVMAERVIAPFSWTVREFVLIHSVFGRSRHEVLGRWPLTGPAACGGLPLAACETLTFGRG